MFKRIAEAIRKRPIIGWAIFFVTLVGVFLLGLLAASITERRAEIATIVANRIDEIEPMDPRSEKTIKTTSVESMTPGGKLKKWTLEVSTMVIRLPMS